MSSMLSKPSCAASRGPSPAGLRRSRRSPCRADARRPDTGARPGGRARGGHCDAVRLAMSLAIALAARKRRGRGARIAAVLPARGEFVHAVEATGDEQPGGNAAGRCCCEAASYVDLAPACAATASPARTPRSSIPRRNRWIRRACRSRRRPRSRNAARAPHRHHRRWLPRASRSISQRQSRDSPARHRPIPPADRGWRRRRRRVAQPARES